MSGTRVLACIKQQSIRQDNNGVNQGNGKDDHAPIGLRQGNVYRDLLQFEEDYSGIYRLQKAVLQFHTSHQVHAVFGANPRVTVRRNLAVFSEAGGKGDAASGGSVWEAGLGGHNDWPGPAGGTVVLTSDVLTRIEDKDDFIDVTDLMEAILPATILKRSGAACDGLTNDGFQVRATDESDFGRTWEYFSRRAGNAGSGLRPTLKLTFIANRPPLAPIVDSPLSGDVQASTTGTDVTVRGKHQDPDGDGISNSQVQVWSSTTQDPATVGGPPTAGTLIADTTKAQTLADYVHKVTGLGARTAFRFRTRTQDDRTAAAAWGVWTLLADGDFTTAYQTAKPQNVFVDATTLVPVFGAQLSSSDPGDYVTAMQVILWDDSLPGSGALWDSGKTDISGSPTRPTLTYNGPTLREALRYRCQIWLWNRDDIQSPTSGDVLFIIHIPTGPVITINGNPASTAFKIDDTTPPFDLLFAAVIDQYELEVYRVPGTPRDVIPDVPDGADLVYDKAPTASGSGTSLTGVAATDIITATAHGFVADQRIQFTALTGGAGLSTGVTYWIIAGSLAANTFKVSATQGGAAVDFTTAITAGTASAISVVHSPTTALANGGIYHVRGAGRPAGGTQMGPWSPLYPIYINALADPPAVTFFGVGNGGLDGGNGGVMQPNGSTVVSLTTGATLGIVAPFSDPDLGYYTEAPTAKETNVRVAATPAGSGAHVTASPKTITSGITDSESWATGLTIENSYDVAVRYKDSSGVYGPLSAYRKVKISRPPTVTLTAPANDSEVVDPTPDLDWAYSSPSGKPQTRKRVRVYRMIPG